MATSPSVLGLFALVVLGAGGAACAAPSDEGESTEAAVSRLEAYWADAKKLDLGDLTRVAVGYASNELNDAVSGPSFGARFDPPAVFAAQAEPNRVLPDDMEIKSLDAIVTGLATRFGETELGTEANKVRLEHLKQSTDNYYVESAFTVRAGANFQHGWRFDARGLADVDGVSLGFDPNVQLVSRVIVAAPDEKLQTLVKAPLAAAKEMRGFVYPRSIEDIRKMKPGEMFALRGLGKLGGNFGLGSPVLVAEPTGGLAYRVVVSAGVSGVIGGQVDVQLVRLDGDQVVVDVGVENGKGVSFRAALRDGWGIKGICDDGKRCLRKIDLGVGEIDLARLVEKAVEKRLNKHYAIHAEGGAGVSTGRVSISRFRFHLDKGDPTEVSRALEQALKLDVRLAQALYNRDLDQPVPAVTAEFDAVRAATTSTRNFGFEVLGMNIYHRAVVKKEGTFVVQTPEGTQSILFDTVNKHSGWFQMDHGFKRTGVAAQTLDARNPDAFRSEANLFIQTAVGDKHMDDDVLIDNVDALLLGLGGHALVEAVDATGNTLERTVWEKCPVEEDRQNRTKRWDEECNVKLLDDPAFTSLKAKGLADIEPLIARLPEPFKKLARDATNLRLTLQSVGIHHFDSLNGPNASFTLDLRLDDKALSILTSRSKEQYAEALKEYLVAIHADRRKVGKEISKDDVRRAVDDKWGRDIENMAAKFESRAKKYKRITDAERLIPVALEGRRWVNYPLGVRFSVDGNSERQYESAIINSTSHERAQAAAALFDDLRDEARHINAPLYDEHTAAFPLLALVPAPNLQVGMDVQADVRSTFWVKRERYLKSGFKSVLTQARGGEVSTISAGLFDLDAILEGK